MSLAQSIAADQQAAATAAEKKLWQALASGDIDASRITRQCELAGWSIDEFDQRHAAIERYRNAVLAKEKAGKEAERLESLEAEIDSMESAHRKACDAYEQRLEALERNQLRIAAAVSSAAREFNDAAGSVPKPSANEELIIRLRKEAQAANDDSFRAKMRLQILRRDHRLLERKVAGNQIVDGADATKLADIAAEIEEAEATEQSSLLRSENASTEASQLEDAYLKTLIAKQ